MLMGTANIQNFNPDLTPEQVKADGVSMGEACGFWGGSEIDPQDDDFFQIMAGLGREKWLGHLAGTPLPYFMKKRNFIVLETAIRHYPVVKHLQFVPHDRIHTGLIVKLKMRPRLPAFAVINNHFTSGAYNAGRPFPLNLDDRKAQWDLEMLHLKKFIHDFQRLGLTTFVMGDFNHPRVPKPIVNFEWLAGPRLDRIGVTTTGSVKVTKRGEAAVKLKYGDHTGYVVDVRLDRA
jgi:hypothetical protein